MPYAHIPNAYIIEVHGRTAGIVARDGYGFRFFSSARAFDRIEGHRFGSARDAERAAKALFDERQRAPNRSQFAVTP